MSRHVDVSASLCVTIDPDGRASWSGEGASTRQQAINLTTWAIGRAEQRLKTLRDVLAALEAAK